MPLLVRLFLAAAATYSCYKGYREATGATYRKTMTLTYPYRLAFRANRRTHEVYADSFHHDLQTNTIRFDLVAGKKHAIEAMFRRFSSLPRRYQPARELQVIAQDGLRMAFPDPVIAVAGKWDNEEALSTVQQLHFTYIREPITFSETKHEQGTTTPKPGA